MSGSHSALPAPRRRAESAAPGRASALTRYGRNDAAFTAAERKTDRISKVMRHSDMASVIKASEVNRG